MKLLLIVLIFTLFTGCASQPVLQTAPIPSPTSPSETFPEASPTSAPPTSTPVEIPPTETTPAKTEPVSEPPPVETQSPAGLPNEVNIETSDGLLISGTFHPGSGEPPWPGVLLMHMVNGSRGQWDALVPLLTGAGYAVLAVDLRGHGNTGGQIDWDKAQQDTLSVLEYLSEREDVQAGNIALGGASIGANLALTGASSEAGVKTALLLSPGINNFGVTTMDALESYGARPLFLAASSEDQYAAESTQSLADAASGEVELLLFDGAGHGTVMLDREAMLADAILQWLQGIMG